MNKIYIDLYSKEEEKNSIESKSKFITALKKIKYQLKNMFCHYKVFKFEGDMGIKVDVDFLNSVCLLEKRKYSIQEKKLLKSLSAFFSEDNVVKKVKVIFSKELDEKINCTKYIIKLFDNVSNLNFDVVTAKNEILEHDMKHIDRYVKAKNLKKDKIKVLVMFSSISDYNDDKMIEYINKYKEVDVAVTEKLSRNEIFSIIKNLDLINNEYGSTIQILKNKRDLKRYNVYILFSNKNRRKLMSDYILNPKALFIDTCDVDSDFLNSGYKMFVKNETKLKQIFKNLELDIDKFGMVALGEAFK